MKKGERYMNIVKRIAVTLLVLILTFSITGCGNVKEKTKAIKSELWKRGLCRATRDGDSSMSSKRLNKEAPE